MNDVNKAELRRLAEAAAHKDWYAGNAYDKPFILKYQIITDTPDGKYVLLDGNKNFPDDCVANVAFVGAANPAAVLSLLDECERLQATCEGLDRQNDAISDEIGKVAAERDAALAELEACRKDAERYRLLRAAHWWESPLCVVRHPKRQVKPGTDCPSGERLDEAVDAIKPQEARNG